jgi:hypothetical protein
VNRFYIRTAGGFIAKRSIGCHSFTTLLNLLLKCEALRLSVSVADAAPCGCDLGHRDASPSAQERAEQCGAGF